MLGDRLLLAKTLLMALEAGQLDEDQCERLFAMCANEQLSGQPIVSALSPEALRSPSVSDELAEMDDQERQEAVEAHMIPAHVAEDLANLHPIKPVEPGENLLDDPEDFVARVAAQRARRSRQMGR